MLIQGGLDCSPRIFETSAYQPDNNLDGARIFFNARNRGAVAALYIRGEWMGTQKDALPFEAKSSVEHPDNETYIAMHTYTMLAIPIPTINRS